MKKQIKPNWQTVLVATVATVDEGRKSYTPLCRGDRANMMEKDRQQLSFGVIKGKRFVAV